MMSFFLLFFHFLLFMYSSMGVFLIFDLNFFLFSSLPFSFLFLVDWISLVFSSFVLLISSVVMIYSGYYMKGDVYMFRFIYVFIMFVLSMVFLIFSGNFFMIMIGWDGLGLVSFCLVIYYSDKDALCSGLLTVFMNRLGDGLILISIFYLNLVGGFNLDLFFYSSLGSFFLLVSFLTSSAQFPFSSWLPAAMSAPTPISSLVHSSTLVTAGVYLSIRFSYIFVVKEMSVFLILVSLLTMMLGGILANYEKDFKKVVAMSTLSQLGMLFFLISIGFLKLSFFHMISHAFFKSLLFMGTGVVIFDGMQDSRYKGSYLISSYLVNSVMLVSLFSLMAVPFSVGFYSKDIALDFMFCGNIEFMMYLVFVFCSLMTVMYTLRIVFFVFSFNRTLSLGQGSVSFFLYVSLFFGSLFTIFWGKFLFYMVLMEDFVLISFPMKSIGFVLLFLGMFFVMKNSMISFFYSFMIFFKYVVSLLFVFDFYFKFDQIWLEKVVSYNLENFVFMYMNFGNYVYKSLFFSFFCIWFFIFMFFSLTT